MPIELMDFGISKGTKTNFAYVFIFCLEGIVNDISYSRLPDSTPFSMFLTPPLALNKNAKSLSTDIRFLIP